MVAPRWLITDCGSRSQLILSMWYMKRTFSIYHTQSRAWHLESLTTLRFRQGTSSTMVSYLMSYLCSQPSYLIHQRTYVIFLLSRMQTELVYLGIHRALMAVRQSSTTEFGTTMALVLSSLSWQISSRVHPTQRLAWYKAPLIGLGFRLETRMVSVKTSQIQFWSLQLKSQRYLKHLKRSLSLITWRLIGLRPTMVVLQ